jgi:hypothetical protein
MTHQTRLLSPLDPAPARKLRPILLIAFVAVVALVACGGGGGSSTHSDPNNVSINGVVDDGSGQGPIAGATCRFVDMDGQVRATDTCGQGGQFSLSVPSALQGYIYCSPPTTPQLKLSTFTSTLSAAPGSSINNENVTPATTIVADIVRNGDGAITPEARKLDLLLKMQTGEDLNLNIVVAMAARLYRAMLAQQVNAGFGDGGSGGDGEGGDGANGGASGDAGDGADFSPLAGIECTFVVGSDPADAEAVYPAALADFLADGQLDRPDLAGLAEQVNEGLEYTPEEIQQAFVQVFEKGLGQAYTTVTDSSGHYFLPIPPNLPGFVRCAYPDRSELTLATYVPGYRPGSSIDNQDVTPADTVFSSLIAPQIEGDLSDIKENYLSDINGLSVMLTGPNLPQGPLTGIQLGTAAVPQNFDVGLVAFTATALYNSFYKNGLKTDYAAMIQALSAHLTADLTVDPAFLESLGLPADQATVVSESIRTAGEQLDTDLPAALSTARINVTVLDADDDGRLVENALVDISHLASGIICEGCGGSTDANGQLTLTLTNIPEDQATEVVATVSSVPGYGAITAPAFEVVPLATVDLEVALSNTTTFDLNVQGGGEGGGRVVSNPAGIDCTLMAGALSGDGSEPYAKGTEIELTATPDPNSAFTGWSGDACAQAGSTCALTLTADTTITASFAPRCDAAEYLIEASPLSFAAHGGSGTLTVSAPEGCPWSVTADKSWISIDPESANGIGEGSVAFTVGANSGAGRSAALMAAGQNFTVDQEAAPCVYTLTPSEANSPAGGGPDSFAVNASYAACTLPTTALTSDTWVTISSVGGDAWPVSVSYAVDPNTGPGRSATITIAEKIFAIEQAAADCSYTLSPTFANPDAAGGTDTISVTPSYAGCTTAWTATSDATWVSITNGASGSGEGTVTYHVDPNTGAERKSTLTVADHDFTITQSDPYLIDQQNWPPFSSGVEIDRVALNHYYPRQSFTPTFNRLTGVDVYLETVDAGNGDEAVIVRIFSDGSEVGRASQHVQAGFAGSLHFDFASELVIAPGETATLAVTNSSDGSLKANSTFAWRYSILDEGGTYSGGRAWHSDMPWADQDFLFRTYGYNQGT